jgi:hypothetical protein
MDVHLFCQHVIIVSGGFRESITPGSNRGFKLSPAELIMLRRQRTDRIGDYRIAEPRLECVCHRVPYRPVELHEEPAVDIAAVPRGTRHVRILRSEVGQLRCVLPGKVEEEAVVLGKGLIPIPGNRDPPPRLGVAVSNPYPLIPMSIPVPDQHIEESRSE